MGNLTGSLAGKGLETAPNKQAKQAFRFQQYCENYRELF